MSRKANPTLIGTFVLVGIALSIAIVLFVSSAHLFTRRELYVLYFEDSLTGLEPGAAVKFRGVTVGSVKEILIHYNQKPEDTALPVIIELNERLLTQRADQSANLLDEGRFQEAIKRGLRGKLDTLSFLTGLLYVDLDFLPDRTLKWHQLTPVYKEIPTALTGVQIFQVDFAELMTRLNGTLARLDKAMGDLQVNKISASLTNLLTSLNNVVASPDTTNTLAAAHATLDEVRLLSQTLRRRVETVGCSAEEALAESRETLREVRGGVQDLREVLTPESTLRRDLNDALEQLSEAARSVNALADFLHRHPNAVISGRKTAEPK